MTESGKCSIKQKLTLQGAKVDASIADIVSVLNKCNDINSISSCSGLKEDHCGNTEPGYISFIRSGSGDPKSGMMQFNPPNIRKEDVELYNTIKDAGWFAELGATYFHNSVTARLFPILASWRITGKRLKQERTPIEKNLESKTTKLSQTIKDAPDPIKLRKWYQLAFTVSKNFCPNNRDIVANMFLYGDNPTQAQARLDRWERTGGELTEEDQVSDERLSEWAELTEGTR